MIQGAITGNRRNENVYTGTPQLYRQGGVHAADDQNQKQNNNNNKIC